MQCKRCGSTVMERQHDRYRCVCGHSEWSFQIRPPTKEERNGMGAFDNKAHRGQEVTIGRH